MKRATNRIVNRSYVVAYLKKKGPHKNYKNICADVRDVDKSLVVALLA